MNSRHAFASALVLAALLAVPASAGRDACSHRDPLRQPLFGDLHIHTSYSHDAASQGTRLTPRDAYRFARGERVGIQPHDDQGRPLRSLQLERPLDFAAVTDHAETFGEIRTCQTPGLPGHDSFACWLYRERPGIGALVFAAHTSLRAPRYSFCGTAGEGCLETARSVWQDTRDAADEANDETNACAFASLIAYEWTATAMPNAANLHRNIIFGSRDVPDDVVTSVEFYPAEAMWRELRRVCRPDDGCEFISIPHNSNLSSEKMFRTKLLDGTPLDRELAAERGRSEPLVEIFQHKGSSECSRGIGTSDELCGFENLPYDSFLASTSGIETTPGPMNFVRNALGEGLRQHARLGANPFAFGIIGSTDTHLGTPGYTEEIGYAGHGGAGSIGASANAQLSDKVEFNPGGLAVAWAEENSRESIFAAMRRREVYGTSGPRMVVRFFGGFALDDATCDDPRRVERGYADGVPMGGNLSEPPGAASQPRFLLFAVKDAGTRKRPGTPLARLQIIKLSTAGGDVRERVIDVATADDEGGSDTLCNVWRDADFDPAEHAVYYGRVVELPTPRWHALQCAAAGIQCGESVPDGFAACCDGRFPHEKQERAWTSPIWYAPAQPAPSRP